MSEVNLEVNAQFGPLTSTLEVVTRMNLAYQHLLAANNFARLAHEIEIQNADQPFGEFFNDIIGYVSGAVIMSVAALEAYINEIFVDYQIYLPGYDQVLFDEYWSEINRHTKILDKYQKVLKLIRVWCRRPPLHWSGARRNQAARGLLRRFLANVPTVISDAGEDIP